MIEQQKNNDALRVILSRRSIRRYTDEPVTEDQLKAVLEAIFASPSAHDYRPVEIIVAREQATRDQLAQVGRYTKMFTQAPVGLAICGDKKKQTINSLLINDCSAAIENALLAAHAIGLGAVWCGVVEDSDMQRQLHALLALPEHIVPMGLIALGHPAEERAVPDRYDEKRVHIEKW